MVGACEEVIIFLHLHASEVSFELVRWFAIHRRSEDLAGLLTEKDESYDCCLEQRFATVEEYFCLRMQSSSTKSL